MLNSRNIIITGGAGFIGSNLIRHIIEEYDFNVINIDKLTYAGNLNSLRSIADSPRYSFHKIDICDYSAISNIILKYKPAIIMHLAAESHVDRSINSANEFIQTNILGTFNILEAIRNFYSSLDFNDKNIFRFHHISTDEVYGDLGNTDNLFTELTPYNPSSPYSASKASSDHLVHAWSRTYDIPALITNCSNNYGPFHHPEKLIPLTIINAINGKKLPVYGHGQQIRDWLYVGDHVKALMLIACNGVINETYNIGGNNEKKNIDVVRSICTILDGKIKNKPNNIKSFADLICYVDDRPGHDQRYAIDASKLEKDLDWKPGETFTSGLEKTVEWYLKNDWWWKPLIENGDDKL